MTQTWVVATRSRGKIAELVPMLSVHGIAAISLTEAGVPESPDEGAIECFDTFEENAVAKARYFHARTGRPCLADDSGLCVDALAGRPGVRSRRFAADTGWSANGAADEDARNTAALLQACHRSGLPAPWPAHYVCVAALVGDDVTRIARGTTDGVIIPAAAGDGGFGYDPVFRSAELEITFGEAAAAAKAAVSHRARAVTALLESVFDASARGTAR